MADPENPVLAAGRAAGISLSGGTGFPREVWAHERDALHAYGTRLGLPAEAVQEVLTTMAKRFQAGDDSADVQWARAELLRRAHLHPRGRAQYVEERLPPVTDAIRDAMRLAAELLPFPENDGVIGRLNLALVDIENTYGRGREVDGG